MCARSRALYLPTYSHFLIVNKTSLSLSLSRERDRERGREREAAQTGTDRACQSSSRKQDTGLVPSSPAMYAKHMVDGPSGGHAQLREMALKRSLRCGTRAQSPHRSWGGNLLSRPSTLTDTRPPCFEVEKHALRLGASAHYLPTNLGPFPLRTGFP